MKKTFFLPILEPNLNDAHVETGVLGELLSNVSRRLRTTAVSAFKRF